MQCYHNLIITAVEWLLVIVTANNIFYVVGNTMLHILETRNQTHKIHNNPVFISGP